MIIQMLLLKMLHYFHDEEGATMIEYSLLAALISVVAIVAITAVGSNVNLVFNNVASKLAGAL